LSETQWQVEQLASAAGLRVIECAIAEEVRHRTGEKYQRDGGDAYRWGSQGGYAMFAGRKVPIQKPRIQDKADKRFKGGRPVYRRPMLSHKCGLRKPGWPQASARRI
jgi:hypothetical protein